MHRPQNRTAALLAAFGCALAYLPAGRALAAVCAALPLSAAGQSFALHCAAAPLAECACRRRCLRCSTAERPESPMRWCWGCCWEPSGSAPAAYGRAGYCIQ